MDRVECFPERWPLLMSVGRQESDEGQDAAAAGPSLCSPVEVTVIPEEPTRHSGVG